MVCSVELDRSKVVRPEWQATLDRYFPRSLSVSWFVLDYLSDDRGDPIERYVIYQMVPRAVILPHMLAAFEGPHPDTLWDWRLHPITKKMVRYQTGPVGLTVRNWELYQQHHAQARLFWIIQGSGGGHRYRVNDPIERKVRRMAGLPADTPAPGALPFAEFDWRVLDNLLDLDDVRKYTRVADLLNRTGQTMDAEDQQAAEDARYALTKWWAKQVDEMVDSAGMVGKGGWWARHRHAFPYTGEATIQDADVQLEQFITDRPHVGA